MRFGSSLDGAGFEAIRSDGEACLGDGGQDDSVLDAKTSVRAEAQILFEDVEHLEGGLETQLPWQDMREAGGLGHDSAHPVVGE